ncbi:vitamin B6 photo-protection and homoeostasis-domain-containing protein [Cladochytrium replicatum]|nr:vitamin B6 photo-protection and homoeostasis-domain-containing protein [Cladochytrium replicatum]
MPALLVVPHVARRATLRQRWPMQHCQSHLSVTIIAAKRSLSSIPDNSKASGKDQPKVPSAGQLTPEIRQRISRGVRSRWTVHSNIAGAWQKHTISTNGSPENSRQARLFEGFNERVRQAFLPKGFPHSVTKDYLPYTLYNFVHSVSGTITGTLSMQALLLALGMSASQSITLAATTNWIIKDGFGLLGGVIYASVVSNRFDANPKRFRFVAALMLQVATIAEMMTPLFPGWFLLMASASNIMKNISYLATSATRASMHKGFAREDNLGDITGKSGAQNTAAGLVGTGFGVVISWILEGTGMGGAGMAGSLALWSVFVPLCAINLVSAYIANVKVATRSMNQQRLELAWGSSVNQIISRWTSGTRSPNALTDGLVLVAGPEDVSAQEQFVIKFNSKYENESGIAPLHIEPLVGNYLERCVLDGTNRPVSEVIMWTGAMDGYRAFLVEGKKPGSTEVVLWFVDGSSPLEQVRGVYHSVILVELMEKMGRGMEPVVVKDSQEIVETTFPQVWEQLGETGWERDSCHVAWRGGFLQVHGKPM